jgi:hypothetical protein
VLSGRSAACVALCIAGCARPLAFHGVDAASGTTVELLPGQLLAPEAFAGSYRSPQLGLVELSLAASELRLRYTRTTCGCQVQGQAQGVLDGNLAALQFRESVTGCSQRAELVGRGFVFCRREPGRPLTLHGAREYLVQIDTYENGTPETEWRPAGPFQAEKLDASEPVAPSDPQACP